uniref:Leucine-rich repeat-containing G-protein coupled receptor 6-like n=1 Tax=Saccoglossus kowalevskii TaxID=10224 RepID=A0ABM0MSX0_SACKO|nr:PREDICTED: leucine-rich repeat-containing G-protein coupled receptor 6-like [Saccoglossus kowalevskii]
MNNIPRFPSAALENMNDLIFLSLDDNAIERITRKNLAVLISPMFQHLNLSNNLINYISTKALSQLDNLAILILHSQKDPYQMTTIKYDAFEGISNDLTTLFISDNSLPYFPHAVFEGDSYDSLKYLHADGNQISNITTYSEDQYTATTLVYYNVKKEQVEHFGSMPNLLELYLGANAIDHINDTYLCNLESILVLFLEGNYLDETNLHDDAFACIPTLETLNLNNNLFQYVPEAVVTNDTLPSIRNLYMDSNKLTFLLAETFTALTTLEVLRLSSNDIISIEDKTFPADIQTIKLRSNSFHFLHENPFYNLTQLNTLDLSGNVIDYIPDTAFDYCINLDNLDLSSNQIGRILDTTLEDCPLTNTLDLSYNELAYIEPGSFAHFTSLVTLDLSNNHLTVLPNDGDFVNVSITNFGLDNNRLTSLPAGIFSNIQGINTFDLTNNDISSIGSYAFDNIDANFIYLTDNPLSSLAPYSFNDITCRRLDLKNMYLPSIPSNAFNNIDLQQYL